MQIGDNLHAMRIPFFSSAEIFTQSAKRQLLTTLVLKFEQIHYLPSSGCVDEQTTA